MTVITCTWRSWRAAQNMQQSFRLRSCMRFEKTGQRNRLFSRASAYRGDFAPNRTQSPDQDTLKDGCEETKRIDSIYEGRTHYNTVHQQANAVFSSSIEVPKPNRGLYADLLSGNHDGHIPHYFTILTARSSDFVNYHASGGRTSAYCCRPQTRSSPSEKLLYQDTRLHFYLSSCLRHIHIYSRIRMCSFRHSFASALLDSRPNEQLM